MAISYDALPHGGGHTDAPSQNSNYDDRFQDEQIDLRCVDKYLNAQEHFHVVVPIEHNFRLIRQIICYSILFIFAMIMIGGFLIHNNIIVHKHKSSSPSSSTRTSWMNQYWDQIQHKTILELTLPGSHNSGTYQNALSPNNDVCTSDYRYSDYLKDPSWNVSSPSPLSQIEFDKQFIPWNINHDLSIQEQLDYGARYFHLKLCIMENKKKDRSSLSSSLQDLSYVVHNHRGYTTQETLQDFIQTMQQFLKKNPKDIIVLGLNNIHFQNDNDDTTEQLESLYTAISRAFHVGNNNNNDDNSILISQQDLQSTNLQELVLEQRKRIAVFVKTTDTMDLTYLEDKLTLIPSSKGLIENWDDKMSHGNLTASEEWLYQDIISHASSWKEQKKNTNTTRTSFNKFYTLQANPNHADDIHIHPNMFSEMNKNKNDKKIKSLKEWETPLLLKLNDIITRAQQRQEHLHINAISTDFFNASQPLEIALRLMGLS